MKKIALRSFLFGCFMLGLSMTTLLAQTKADYKKKYKNSDLYKELEKKMQSDMVYPDSIVLPPLHYINTMVSLDSVVTDFQNISIDITVKDDLPDSYKFYISPFNTAFNYMPFYCGIQTASGGKPIGGSKDEEIGRGGIFSRWYERDTAALRTEGYYASSDGEGDFIGVRNKLKWGKGTYRLTLSKTGYVPGKVLPDSANQKDLMFSWGEYEHSWVTMTIEDLERHQITTIGSLAFPGKRLKMAAGFTIFLEQYGAAINFAKNRDLPFETLYYQDIPVAHIVFDHIVVNGKPVIPKKVQTYHNRTHHPEQKKITMPIPLLSKVVYDPITGSIDCVAGKFVDWKTPIDPE